MRTRALLVMFILSLAPLACGPGGEDNQAPVADIEVDEDVVPVGQEVILDAANSSDPDGDPIIFRWTLRRPAESSAELSARRGQRVSFVPDIVGDYTVELIADDGALESSKATVVISARDMNTNQEPVADAGMDITTEPEQQVQLDGSASSDPDGDALTYAWTVDSQPTGTSASLDDDTVAKPTFTPDIAGTWVFTLEVSDPDGASDTDMVLVEVVQVNPNDPPTAEAGEPQTVEVGKEVTVDGGDSADPNGDTLTYSWTIDTAPSGSTAALSNADQAVATFTPDVEGEYVISLTVDDGEASASDTITITAEPALPCLIIGEMHEGSSFNKAVEIYNCGGTTLDLTGFGFCLVSNDDTTCSRDLVFTGELAAGDVRLVCHPQLAWPMASTNMCDLEDTVTNFNGDDRMFVFEDSDGSGTYTTSDRIIDAFGQIADRPSASPWAEAAYRRCNFEQFDGQGPFDDTLYYTKTSADDFSDLGVAPTEGCP